MWQDLKEHHYAFPTWGLMTHGFYNWLKIGGAPDPGAGLEGDASCCDEPIADFADHVVMTLMRGVSDWELLLNLHQMTPQKWEYLGRGLKWGREHWDVLSDTQMILGNPSAFQVYGYTHFRGARGIISVRNPSNKRQNISLILNSGNGVWRLPSNGLHARQIYPCNKLIPGNYREGDAMHISLDAHQIKLIELGDFPRETAPLSLGACSAGAPHTQITH
jgi:hypothetical protein